MSGYAGIIKEIIMKSMYLKLFKTLRYKGNSKSYTHTPNANLQSVKLVSMDETLAGRTAPFLFVFE